MKPTDVHEQRDRLQLLDVREHDEWTAGHIDGAVHIPLDQLSDRREEVPDDRTVVCLCRSGSRSEQAARSLARSGYSADNLDGGMQAWSEAGLPLIADDGAPPRVA